MHLDFDITKTAADKHICLHFLKIYENAFAAKTPHRTPLVKLTVLARASSWIWRPLFDRELKGRIRKWRGEKEKGGYGRGAEEGSWP